MSAESDVHVLVLGTADWNQSIATNQHYMTREIAESFDVTFVESLGLRKPGLSRRDFWRVIHRLRNAGGNRRTSRLVPKRVVVLSPIVLPIHTGIAAYLNRRRLHRLVASWRRSSGPKILWTYSPVTYGLEEFADQTIYHCVDLLAEFPGIPDGLIRFEERRLAKQGVVTIASSATVVRHLTVQGFNDVALWPNVADVEAVEAVKPLVDSRCPSRIVFAGNMTPSKVDFELLMAVVTSGLDLHLAGPIAEGGGSGQAHLARLVKAGATYHGSLSLSELARLYWSATVGLIPYRLTTYTLGVNPLKTYEYLASGLAVVSTAIPAVERRLDDIVVTATNDEFVAATRRLSTSQNMESIVRRSELARVHSWSQRGDQARTMIRALLIHDAQERK